MDVSALRDEFPALRQHVQGRPLVYLDSAATAQRPRVVIDAVADFYRHDNANVHRGMYELARRATDRYEAARAAVARFLNVADVSEIVFTRGTTEAVNLVASSWGGANLQPGDEIQLSILELHSNIVPWQLVAQRTGARLRYLDIDEEGRLRLDQLDALLTARTKIVALAHVSNALGTINPVREICERAHGVGARVLVDGAQGAPHLKLDLQALGCDFYCLSGHKMCGPMGIGALWARRELLEAMPPYHGGGEMIDVVELERSTYAPPPQKFEAGTPNVVGAIGLGTAIEFLEGIGHEALWAHEQTLVQHGLDRLAEVPGLHLFGPRVAGARTAVFSFRLEGVHPHDAATILDAEGIAVRAGHHCTQPLMRRLGVPATTRASCYLYNTPEDIDHLVQGLDVVGGIFG
ncbi:MAG: cysteine desulfurase [Gemmatimonadetes bacterium]|nr:cysteine desulfurase [Gemmatimonadota bacterium]